MQKKYLVLFSLVALFSLAIVLRVVSLPFVNRDLLIHNLPWYETLIHKGALEALGTNFSNYTPPYTYLLALTTLARQLLTPVISIKLIPISFDLICAIIIYKIVKLKYPTGFTAPFACAVFLAAPTILINSAFWGQADSLYTCLLVACLYFLLVDKPIQAMLAFAMSFAFKAQAVFFIPFLLVMAIRKRVHWWTFGFVPLVYILTILPVIILGRAPVDALFIYLNQAGTYNRLSMKAPNLYSFMPLSWFEPGVIIGSTLAVMIILFWLWHTSRTLSNLGANRILLVALVSVAMTPFLLPKMHDRYFYPADVISIILAFYWPALWFVPVVYQVISFMAYTNFFYNLTLPTLYIATILNTFMLAWLLRLQLNMDKPIRIHQTLTKSLAGLAALMVPLAILGLIIRLMLSITFLKIEYNLPSFPKDAYGFSTTDRLTWSPYALNYMLNKKEIKFLNRIRFTDGSQVFNDRERLHMMVLKQMTITAQNVWILSLIILVLMGLFAWIGNWLRDFWLGIRNAGWLSVFLAVVLASITIFWFEQFFNSANNLIFGRESWIFFEKDTLNRLFPLRFWKDTLLYIAAFLSAIGASLIIGMGRSHKTRQPQSMNTQIKDNK